MNVASGLRHQEGTRHGQSTVVLILRTILYAIMKVRYCSRVGPRLENGRNKGQPGDSFQRHEASVSCSFTSRRVPFDDSPYTYTYVQSVAGDKQGQTTVNKFG